MRIRPGPCPACLLPRSTQVADESRFSAGFTSLRSAFVRATKIERSYASRLRSIARHVGDILRGHDLTQVGEIAGAQNALRRYSEALTPWAEAAAKRMVTEVAQRDERSWFKVAHQIGEGLKREIREAPTGQVMQALQREQVGLIKSIPTEAAERVHRLAREGIAQGMRPDTLAAHLMETEGVTKARADLIARTETGRAATVLTQARAQHVGSEGYTWTTAGDSDVRASHKGMNGKFVRWDSPPELDGLVGHAGALPNCRCVPIPVISD